MANHSYRRALYAALFGLVALVQVAPAQAAGPVAAPGAFDDFMQRVTGAGKQTVDFSKNGTPVAAPGVPQVNTDGGMPKVEQTGNIRNPSGNPVNVKVTGRIPPTQVAAAVGRALGKVLGPLAAGMAIWELCQELQFGCERAGSSGPITFTKKNPEICTVGPCYEYSIDGAAWFTTKTAACTAHIVGVNAAFAAGGNGYIANQTSSSPTCAWSVTHANGFDYGSASRNYATRAGTPAAPGTGDSPSTQQEFLDAIASKSGWPSSSAIAEVLSQSTTIGGPKIQPQSITISGPATSPGTTTTTNNTTNNTTKTESTTHNHNYEGDTITTTSVTTTIITNNLGDVISNETKTETPSEDIRTECEKNPQSINCGDLDTPEGEIPRATKDISYSPESLFGGGSCPANHVSNLSGGKQIVLSYGPTCDAFTNYLRPMIIAIALYMAYLIILPGAKV